MTFDLKFPFLTVRSKFVTDDPFRLRQSQEMFKISKIRVGHEMLGRLSFFHVKCDMVRPLEIAFKTRILQICQLISPSVSHKLPPELEGHLTIYKGQCSPASQT